MLVLSPTGLCKAAPHSIVLLLPHVPLCLLQVDPFDAQEAKPYKQDPEIIAMTNLVDAYQNNNINEFERILRSNRCAVPAAMHANRGCWPLPAAA